jgi:hypothetical protein
VRWHGIIVRVPAMTFRALATFNPACDRGVIEARLRRSTSVNPPELREYSPTPLQKAATHYYPYVAVAPESRLPSVLPPCRLPVLFVF